MWGLLFILYILPLLLTKEVMAFAMWVLCSCMLAAGIQGVTGWSQQICSFLGLLLMAVSSVALYALFLWVKERWILPPEA